MLDFSQYAVLYLLTVPVFFAVDMLWIGVIAKGLYKRQLGHLMRTRVMWSPAIIFYLLYIFGIIFFAVLPGLEGESLRAVIVNGALFGFLAYATYDLTNLSTLKDWPKSITFIDIAWGTFLTTFVAIAAYNIALWIK